MFAGGNSARGFHSLFHHMFDDQIEQIFLLKGGPGTGKSTLMQNLAAEAEARGLPVEMFFCSSDPSSLDGVVFPSQRSGVVDATAPHVQDPVLPGCREELINLGESWDHTALRKAQKEIAALTAANKAAYARAYRYLRAAEEIEELWAQINKEYLDAVGTAAAASALLRQLPHAALDAAAPAKERHLFAAAITPVGVVDHIGGLAESCTERWVLHWAPGTGLQEVFDTLLSAARLLHLRMEIFHRPMLPSQVEHVIFPDIGLAVLSQDERAGGGLSGRAVDLREHLAKEAAPPRVKELFSELMELAVGELAQAKAIHDELEDIYVSAVDFTRTEQVRQYLTERIFAC